LSHPLREDAAVNTLQKLSYQPRLGLTVPPTATPELDLQQVTPDRLRLRDAIRLKSAELWLQLGQPELASGELESLPASADTHPWAMRLQMLVWSALYFE
jgi:hypothetical protein